jgi:arsenite-transporting ATPase
VTMAEDLALLETKRIIESLGKFKIRVRTIYLNKFFAMVNPPDEIRGKMEEQERVVTRMKAEIQGIEVKNIPLLRQSPRGVDELSDMYAKYLV